MPKLFILDVISESKIVFKVLRFTEYKDNFSFVNITSNPMVRVASAAAGRIFPWGGQRI